MIDILKELIDISPVEININAKNIERCSAQTGAFIMFEDHPPVIFLNPKMLGDVKQTVITLAHELGHAIDYEKGELSLETLGIDYDKNPDISTCFKWWETEVSAWKNAQFILEGLDFYDWDTFQKNRRRALRSHFTVILSSLIARGIPDLVISLVFTHFLSLI